MARRNQRLNARRPRRGSAPPAHEAPAPRSPLRRRLAARGRFLGRFVRFSLGSLLLFSVLGLVAASVGGVFYYQRVARALPDVGLLRTYRPSLVTRVYGRGGRLLREFFVERRFLLPFDQIPDVVLQATLATEDARFLDHPGVDVIGVVRAAVKNILDWDIVEGGSTITQQLAKSLFLTPRRNLDRKLREAILAVRIERQFSKREILNIYLNQIYYGHGAYGIEAAARVYFGKSAQLLTLPEAALLAGLPRAPAIYSPLKSKTRARRRRAHVLRRMLDEGYVTPAQREVANRSPIVLAKKSPEDDYADYPVEYVRQEVERRFGATRLYRGGLRIHTTIDMGMQRRANAAVREGILAVDRRRGFRGPIGRVDPRWDEERIWKMVSLFMESRETWPEVRSGEWEPAVVSRVRRERIDLHLRNEPAVLLLGDAAWARPFDPRRNNRGRQIASLRRLVRAGDVILVERLEVEGAGARPGIARVALVQEPRVQAAALVVEPKTGAIRAMVGGYAFERSQFNRAVQAVRPPGSAFKPVVYSAAISEGWTPSDVILDAPVIFETAGLGRDWKPTNFEDRFFGPTTLREAMARSRNVVSVKLAQAVGVDKIIRRARALGISSRLRPNLSLALGSSGVTLLEMTSLYGTFANQGARVEPHILERIEDPEGRTVWRATPAVHQALPPEEAYVVLNLMRQVVENGTAARARSLGRPLAGKTGTTDDFQDAWFIGVSPVYAAGVWVGMDDKSTLGRSETGARSALPIWMDIVRAIHEGAPPLEFPRPPRVSMVYLDPHSGVRMPEGAPGGLVQAFVAGTEPGWDDGRGVKTRSEVNLFREDPAPGEGNGTEGEPPPEPAEAGPGEIPASPAP